MAQMLYGVEPGKRFVWVGMDREHKSIATRSFFRGDTAQSIGKSNIEFLFFREKGRETPMLFFVLDMIYLACSTKGREFLEKHAPGECDFLPIRTFHGAGEFKIWDGKKKEKTDEQFYLIEIRHRLDSVDWECSEAKPFIGIVYETSTPGSHVAIQGGAVDWPPSRVEDGKLRGGVHSTLCLQRKIINGHHIWREHLNGGQRAGWVFVSDELARKIQASKSYSFSFIPMPEV